MNKNLIKISHLIALVLTSTNLVSNDELSSIQVSSSLIKTDEKTATYATEIYTKQDIENFKSKDLMDFLNTQTSLTLAPSYGNTFSPRIDLRGYGIGDGYQNLVVSVNGRRLNNIDMNPQLLSSIPLESIEKIEIIKGSGSVAYGDGANAGVINIITNGKNDNYVKASLGNNGFKQSTFSFGYLTEKFILNGFVDYTGVDASREIPSSNDDNKDFSRNRKVDLKYYLKDDLELRFGRSFTNLRTNYGGSLTLEQYKDNPQQATAITTQTYDVYNTNLGFTYDLSNDINIDFDYNNEDKLAKSSFEAQYDYESFALKTNTNFNKFKITSGIDGFLGKRTAFSTITKKENKAVFISSQYVFNNKTTFSAGARKENVNYYNKSTNKSQDDNLYAYDFGVNYKIDNINSIFANYNRSFQAPDIDRFFKSGNFNGFIDPAIVKTINLGYNNIQKNNKLKVTLFRSDLTNEIYYYKGPTFDDSRNTNIDKSHKYGLELYNKYLINKNFFTTLNYTYLIARIDEENEGNGSFNGKDLPGVSKHNVTVSLGYTYNDFKAVASHVYRSSAYAAEDFDNNNSQKQEAYNSTDLTFSYTYKNMEFFAKIQNLFDESNALWIRDDSIYPVNFERTFYTGLKVKF